LFPSRCAAGGLSGFGSHLADQHSAQRGRIHLVAAVGVLASELFHAGSALRGSRLQGLSEPAGEAGQFDLIPTGRLRLTGARLSAPVYFGGFIRPARLCRLRTRQISVADPH